MLSSLHCLCKILGETRTNYFGARNIAQQQLPWFQSCQPKSSRGGKIGPQNVHAKLDVHQIIRTGMCIERGRMKCIHCAFTPLLQINYASHIQSQSQDLNKWYKNNNSIWYNHLSSVA